MIEVRYELFLALLGAGILGAAVAPALARRWRINLPLSLPIAALAGGAGLGWLLDEPPLDLIAQGTTIQRVTEMAVLLSLTGGGLKLDRVLGFASWGTTWRLLAITMPLCIAATALGGMALMGLAPAVALLLAACLAPTDPVLAASVQVGPPGEAEEAEARFALTSEAGLNDGLAFPFVHLALAAAAAAAATAATVAGDAGRFDAEVLVHWLKYDVLWKIVAGVVAGWVVGAVIGWAVFRLTPKRGVADAFFAVGLTLFSYGAAEMIHAYGFLAVFVAALTFRRSERAHEVHTELHHFVEQTEQLMLIGVVFAAGIAISQGVLAPIGPGGVALALAFLLVVRPAAGWIALAGSGLGRDERFAIAVLGIRGVGSFYYLAYGLTHAPFSIEAGRQLWAVTVLIVALSVVLHGVTAPRIMRWLAVGARVRRRQAGRTPEA